MTTTVDGNVSVRAIAKTFASGKTEKLVYQTLAECDLPSGKVMEKAIKLPHSHRSFVREAKEHRYAVFHCQPFTNVP